MAQALVLATLTPKAKEAEYLVSRLAEQGVRARLVDISLDGDGSILDGSHKRAAMDRAVSRAIAEISDADEAAQVVVGMGGGTGGEIALQVLHALPITFPKVLISTLPFDARAAVADNAIILVPTLADIFGLSPILRDALDKGALVTAGLCRAEAAAQAADLEPSVGITGLGATDGAVTPLVHALAQQNRASTVFHSNGYGGAAFARFALQGAFDAIIDLTPHELTRFHVGGAHIDMPDRFSAGGDLPRIVLPGGLNFMGLGAKSTLPPDILARPHYEHSGYFTHVMLTPDEMVRVTSELAQSLNAMSGPRAVIVPMGGFSHQDRPGGEIENPALRQICLDTLRSTLNGDVSLAVLEDHLFAPDVTQAIVTTLADIST